MFSLGIPSPEVIESLHLGHMLEDTEITVRNPVAAESLPAEAPGYRQVLADCVLDLCCDRNISCR